MFALPVPLSNLLLTELMLCTFGLRFVLPMDFLPILLLGGPLGRLGLESRLLFRTSLLVLMWPVSSTWDWNLNFLGSKLL